MVQGQTAITRAEILKNMMKLTLNNIEVTELLRQDPNAVNDGGFQRLFVKLQGQLNLETKELQLDDNDLRRIPRYAYEYKQGGWQTRLELIFCRTLGPRLERNLRAE